MLRTGRISLLRKGYYIQPLMPLVCVSISAFPEQHLFGYCFRKIERKMRKRENLRVLGLLGVLFGVDQN